MKVSTIYKHPNDDESYILLVNDETFRSQYSIKENEVVLLQAGKIEESKMFYTWYVNGSLGNIQLDTCQFEQVDEDDLSEALCNHITNRKRFFYTY